MNPITVSLLAACSRKERAALLPDLAQAMNEFFPLYEITSEKRQEHFLAQALHEADGFHTLQEYASGDAYDTRTDLGNTKAKDGDGRKYKGRGIFQTTGRTNYKTAGGAMGIDALAQPELLASPRYAVWSACIYWKSRGLNAFADRDDIRGITKRINGGYNGLAERQRYLDIVRKLIGEEAETPGFIGKASSPEMIKALQKALNEKNYQAGSADGRWGKLTRDAVMSFKADNHLDTADQTVALDAVLKALPRVLEMRADATVEDLRAKGSTTVAGADKVQVASLLGGAGAAGSSALSHLEVAGDYWSRIKGVFEPFRELIPDWLLTNPFLYVLPIAGIAIYYAHRIKVKRLAEFKAGKIQ